MRAQVPYLARLARYGTGQAALRPPRQLFPGTYSPARRPGTGESAWPPDSRLPVRPDAGEGALASHAQTVGGTAAPADTGSRDAPGGRAAPHGRAAPDGRAGRAPAAATPDRRSAPPHEGAPPAARPAAAQPSPSWPDPLWGAPVDLPDPAAARPGPGETAGRHAAGPGLRAAALAPGPERRRPAGPDDGQDYPGQDYPGQDHPGHDDHGQRGHVPGDRRIGVASGARKVAAPERSAAAATASLDGWPSPAARDQVADTARDVVAAASDLVPPRAAVPRPASSATGPAGRPRDQRPSSQPQVSIGTIEVTVVPAAPAASQAGANRPSAAGRPRPAAPLAAGMTAGRLEQGLRRWHGIAQG
jgi:hypothetical protein